MPENTDQRTTHIGGNASEAIILSGDGNVVNIQQPQNNPAATQSFFDSTQDDKIADLCEFYLERPEILGEIDKHLNANARCLLICGEPGIGKSALSAFLIRKFQKYKIISDFAQKPKGATKAFFENIEKCQIKFCL